MSRFSLTFPDEWAVLPGGRQAADTVRAVVRATAELDPAAGSAADRWFHGFIAALDRLGVDGFASLALPDERTGGLVQAFCAVGVVTGPEHDEETLRSIAEGGLHPGLERDTTTVALPTGPAVRSAAVRFAEELLDDEGVAPYAAEVRFAVPLGGGRIGVLHFETLSLVYLDELTELFDAIAGTVSLT